MTHFPKDLGEYALGAVLGLGGMGQVFAGRHRLLDRDVALKIRERQSRGGEKERVSAERFRQGARLQAALDHDAVAQVFDYFEQDHLQVMVMELLSGGSVEAAIERSAPLAVAEAVDVGRRAAHALAYAHARGIVHRDIKPGNLVYARSGDPSSVRVTDFGVAKLAGYSGDLTMAGANVGTLWYMPPEQFNQEEPTALVDVYALGATVYEMLTGKVPLPEASHAGLFQRFLDHIPPPPIRAINPQVPLLLAAVVEQALALEPEERVPSAEIFATWMRASIVGSPVERALGRRELNALDEQVAAARGAIDRLAKPLRGALDAALDRLLERGGTSVPPASSPGFGLAKSAVDARALTLAVEGSQRAVAAAPPPTHFEEDDDFEDDDSTAITTLPEEDD